jgi:hypothetical protein
MDYIKLYAATNSQLQELLWLTQTFSRGIKIVFGIEKLQNIKYCKRETRNEKLHFPAKAEK